MELQGRIKLINDTEAFGANGFRKREVLITTDEQYPQHILIEFTQDKCDILNNYSIGQVVKVGINLRGREWVNQQGETKYFNSIQGWRIEANDENDKHPPVTSSRRDTFTSTTTFKDEEHDDLPF